MEQSERDARIDHLRGKSTQQEITRGSHALAEKRQVEACVSGVRTTRPCTSPHRSDPCAEAGGAEAAANEQGRRGRTRWRDRGPDGACAVRGVLGQCKSPRSSPESRGSRQESKSPRGTRSTADADAAESAGPSDQRRHGDVAGDSRAEHASATSRHHRREPAAVVSVARASVTRVAR